MDPFHLQMVNKLYQKYKPVRITQQKEHLLQWNSENTQNLNIYLHNYQTETAIFLATKHEKNNYGTQLFKFFHTENTSKQQKMVAFVRNCLVKMTLRLFQSISVVMNMVPMLLRQFRRLAQGHCWSYANSLKQLILQLHL